jgi:mono/diheme cytochrome c family protein
MRILTGGIGIFCMIGMRALAAPAAPAQGGSPTKGPDLFLRYCAVCHGKDGKGAGPAAAALKATPTDLTQLAKSNGGKFPVGAVRQLLGGGSSTPAHGSAEMPIWGPVFRAMTPDENIAKLRVDNLVRYLETMQQK